MPRVGVTNFYFNNLQFRIDHKEHKLYVIDRAYEKKYELIPEQKPDIPFVIVLKEQE